MEREGGKSRKKKKKLFFALSPSPLSRTLPLPPPRKLQLPARTVAGLPLFHAMQASLRLPSQGLTQVRRGRSGPSAGGGRSSICLREKSCLLPFDSLVLNLRPSLFLSEKKNCSAAHLLHSLVEEEHPRSGRFGADVGPCLGDAGEFFVCFDRASFFSSIFDDVEDGRVQLSRYQ